MGGKTIQQLGFGYVLFPVLGNAVVLVTLAVLINGAFRWRRYPTVLTKGARAATTSAQIDAGAPTHEEIVAAVKSLDSFVDISEEDLVRLTDLLTRRNRRLEPKTISRNTATHVNHFGGAQHN
jgi:CBS-domain-containing membrane protein